MKTLISAFLLASSLVAATTASADILPGPARGRGVKRTKCTQVDAKDGQADQGQIDSFLSNPAYTSVSAPVVTKLDNGSFKVCATFTR